MISWGNLAPSPQEWVAVRLSLLVAGVDRFRLEQVEMGQGPFNRALPHI